MRPDELREALRTVAFTTTTPFTDDTRDVDHDAIGENLDAIERAGGDLYVPCGNTGEYYSLTPDERVAVVETTVDAVAGCVVAGAGGGVDTVVDYAESYAAAGADGLMVMPPSHPYRHERGLRTYYREIADRSPLGVVIYKRGGDVPDAVVAALAGHENVVGVKYADANVKGFAEAVATAEGDVTWIDGLAERFAPAFALEGAEGYTTGVGNFVPETTLALERALAEGDWERAKGVRDRLRPYEQLRDETGPDSSLGAAYNVPAVKTGLDLAGRSGGPVRPPLVDLTEADRERARERYERIGESSV